MRPTMLQLPPRTSKPRTQGLTMMVDSGLPTRQFQDVVESGAEFLDFVKFGWGTAIVTSDLQRKIDVLADVGVDFYFGGTLFEKFVLQDRFDDFRDLCERYGCQHVEVSNGTIDLSHIEKAGYVRKLSAEFKVVSEVGFKDSERSERLAPNRWRMAAISRSVVPSTAHTACVACAWSARPAFSVRSGPIPRRSSVLASSRHRASHRPSRFRKMLSLMVPEPRSNAARGPRLTSPTASARWPASA